MFSNWQPAVEERVLKVAIDKAKLVKIMVTGEIKKIQC